MNIGRRRVLWFLMLPPSSQPKFELAYIGIAKHVLDAGAVPAASTMIIWDGSRPSRP